MRNMSSGYRLPRLAVRLVLSLAFAACTPRTGEAQLVPGALVRVRHVQGCCETTTTGHLVSLDPGSLSLRPVSDSVIFSLPRKEIRSVDLRLGSESHVGTGMLVGAIAGGAIGALIGRSHDQCSTDGGPCLDALGVGVEAVGGALAGLVTGAVIGWQTRSDRWERVELPARVSVRPARSRESETICAVLSIDY
jgi:hypothetical protein